MALPLTNEVMAGWKRHLILLKELFPFTFVVVLWLIHLLQEFMGTSFADYSLYPRTLHGLAGIITAPLLHANFSHLIGNSVPLIVLGMLLFSNYKEIAGKLFWMVYLTNGIVLWLFARDAFHLGASGVVYGLAFFLFFSGFIRKIPRLTMLSFLIVFLYGSMVWGVFPFDPQVSWEAHLYGAISGLIFAYVLRRQGPQPINYWADEEEIESLESSLTEEEKMLLTPEQLAELEKKPETKPDVNSSEAIRINYEYKENDVQIKK